MSSCCNRSKVGATGFSKVTDARSSFIKENLPATNCLDFQNDRFLHNCSSVVACHNNVMEMYEKDQVTSFSKWKKDLTYQKRKRKCVVLLKL